MKYCERQAVQQTFSVNRIEIFRKIWPSMDANPSLLPGVTIVAMSSSFSRIFTFVCRKQRIGSRQLAKSRCTMSLPKCTVTLFLDFGWSLGIWHVPEAYKSIRTNVVRTFSEKMNSHPANPECLISSGVLAFDFHQIRFQGQLDGKYLRFSIFFLAEPD
jgi:hypothetical protein